MKSGNPSLLCDFYEYTMANGYVESGIEGRGAVFDMFFRSVPDGGGFAIMAGVEQMIENIEHMRFEEGDIEYFRSKGIFGEGFLRYLRDFRFTGDVYAVPEGTPIFPGEPIVTVKAPAAQAQMMETLLLLTINHQSLIATKANRIVRAAEGRAVAEFGSRRAQGNDAAVMGARAAYIGGCVGTACTLADELYGVPASGTMAHSWVLMFDSEYEAFERYCEIYPEAATLLVDTYNVLESGIPNAIRAFDEVLRPRGIKTCGIRIDSGDLAFLTAKAREMLDDAGWEGCRIIVSNSLDEHLIRDLVEQGARIDSFGVGDHLITSHSSPVFGGVYKLAAIEKDGEYIPKIKVSENVSKITTPGFKNVYRLYDSGGKAIADYVCLRDEVIDESKPLEIFDPDADWKRKTLTDFTARELLVPIFENGKCVYESPSLPEMRRHCAEQVDTLWDEVKRFANPHRYYVDLSLKLWALKRDMIEQARRGRSAHYPVAGTRFVILPGDVLWDDLKHDCGRDHLFVHRVLGAFRHYPLDEGVQHLGFLPLVRHLDRPPADDGAAVCRRRVAGVRSEVLEPAVLDDGEADPRVPCYVEDLLAPLPPVEIEIAADADDVNGGAVRVSVLSDRGDHAVAGFVHEIVDLLLRQRVLLHVGFHSYRCVIPFERYIGCLSGDCIRTDRQQKTTHIAIATHTTADATDGAISTRSLVLLLWPLPSSGVGGSTTVLTQFPQASMRRLWNSLVSFSVARLNIMVLPSPYLTMMYAGTLSSMASLTVPYPFKENVPEALCRPPYPQTRTPLSLNLPDLHSTAEISEMRVFTSSIGAFRVRHPSEMLAALFMSGISGQGILLFSSREKFVLKTNWVGRCTTSAIGFLVSSPGGHIPLP